MSSIVQHGTSLWRFIAFVTFYVLRFTLLFTALPLLSAPVDESRIPPAATNTVDFLRDIKPILDASCLKCHGPEKPKSRFRVDDRTALLKGGENGVDVIPGQSAKSPLIHYVARLVPEMEMPPEGKGQPLAPQQVALLRAWIDQDLPWSGVEPPSKSIVELAPTVGWIAVDGDKQKFRELHWMREGWNGGFENFLLQQQLDANQRFTLSGHALRDDYKVTLSLEHSAGRFVHAGFEQYRKYYDDSGGYYAVSTPPQFSLGRDLHLDLGKAWIEAGGITPFGLQLTGGYEYLFKEGDKSSTSWLPVDSTVGPRSIYPAAKTIDERVHVLRLDAGCDLAGFRFDDNFRYEFYDLKTRQTGTLIEQTSLDASQIIRDMQQSQNLANAFKVEKQPLDWLLLSGGYLYTRTDGDTGFGQTPVNAAGQPVFGILWNGQGIALEQSSHIFNANAQVGIWEQMTLSAGVQTEWNRQHLFGGANLDFGDPSDPDPLNLVTNRARLEGDQDRYTSEEKFLLRNTQIPFTVLYAQLSFRQEQIDQFETQEESTGLNQSDFARDTAANRDWKQYRAGFNVSPWTRVALNAYAQRRDHDDSFNHRLDEEPRGTSPGQGYPAFITARQNTVDELGTKLTVRPATWLKTTLTYKIVSGDYRTETDPATAGGDSSPGGRVLASEQDAHVYSFNATLTPWRRLYLFSTFSFQDSRTLTADNGSQSIAPYRGHTYSTLASARYVLDEQTDVNLSYDFSSADYTQNNAASGLPLGIDYRSHTLRAGLGRRFWKRFAANLEYVWSRYDEPSGGGFNDFTANGVFGTLRVRWD
jgi:hypothetical protein